MANNSTPLLTQGIRAQTAIAVNMPITKDGEVTAAGGTCIGFSISPATAGARCPVAVQGSAIAVAGGAIAMGDNLQVGANGCVITHASGAIIGRAMNAASGVGDNVEVFIAPYGNVSATSNPLTGGIKYFNGASVPIAYSFPDFLPSLVCSLVAGATASQVGNTVTITATAHGAVGNNSRDGYRIYYPGSPTITAGWYPGFQWVDANTLRFTNPASHTVASESVNGGAAYIALTTICSTTIPGGSIGANGECSLGFIRSSDVLGFSKLLYQFYSGLSVSAASISTAGAGLNGVIGFRNIASEAKQLGIFSSNGTAGSFAPSRAIDSTSDQPLSALVQLPNAGLWISIDQLDYRITYRA